MTVRKGDTVMHGTELGGYAYGMWPVVVFNILLFALFAIGFLKPKKKVEWRSMGVFLGFLAALFVEMYGFPLTNFLLVSLLGKNYPVFDPFSHSSGHLVLVLLGLSHSAFAMIMLHIISNAVIFYGLYILYKGWTIIYASGGKELVTQGVYSHVRHPQYDGIFLITIGFIIQWPSLTTLIMWPILIFAYYRLAMREEINLEKQYGRNFIEYKNRVPAFIPKYGKGG
ncbi:MAG: methyltransferase family protein [Endomicrobiales bacterium]